MPSRAEIERIVAKGAEEAEAARKRVLRIYEGLRARKQSPDRETVGRLINPVLVPLWKLQGAHETLEAIQRAGYFGHEQLQGCLEDARQAIVSKGPPLLLLRDQWKKGLYPQDPGRLAGQLSGVLGPFYIARGAVERLESLLS